MSRDHATRLRPDEPTSMVGRRPAAQHPDPRSAVSRVLDVRLPRDRQRLPETAKAQHNPGRLPLRPEQATCRHLLATKACTDGVR